MFRARDRTNRCRHGVNTALASSRAASTANGPIGATPPTSASMKRPVAKGTAISATVCVTRSGEYTNATIGDDMIVFARNLVRLNRLCIAPFASMLYIYDGFLQNLTSVSRAVCGGCARICVLMIFLVRFFALARISVCSQGASGRESPDRLAAGRLRAATFRLVALEAKRGVLV